MLECVVGPAGESIGEAIATEPAACAGAVGLGAGRHAERDPDVCLRVDAGVRADASRGAVARRQPRAGVRLPPYMRATDPHACLACMCS